MTTARPCVVVDGRALAEPMGGLRRYAEEMLSRLPSLGADIDWRLVAHRSITVPHDRYSLTVLPGMLDALARGPWEDHVLAWGLGARSPAVFFSPYGIVPRLQMPTIAVVHDLVALRLPATLPWHHRWYWKRVARRLIRARRIITNSAATAADVAALLAIPDDRITVTLLAPAAAFTPADPAQVSRMRHDLGLTGPYVLAVGAGSLRKDLKPVAEAVASLPDLELITVGRSPAGVSLRHLGVVDDATLSVLMSGATAVACPSAIEGFGLPVVEAMACGAPVVASRTPAVEEVAGGAAILITGPDVPAWRSAIDGLHRDGELHRRYSDAGLARSSLFSWHSTASATLEIIRQVVSGQRSGSA